MIDEVSYTHLAVFAFIYLVIDIAYVYSSSSFYRMGTGTGTFALGNRWMVGILAYILLIGGFLWVVPKIQRDLVMRKRMGMLGAAALAGASYGVIVYGVFNFTVGAMWDSWSGVHMLRDTAWGTIAAMTMATALEYSSNKKM